MGKIHNFKKVQFDAVAFFNCAIEQGLDISELGRKIGMSPRYFYIAKREGKINPAALFEVRKYVNFDLSEICPNCDFNLVYNGHGTRSGRMRVDWDYIETIASEEGYNLNTLSKVMGHSGSYLYNARVVGGLSANMIKKMAEILGINPEAITENVEPEVVNIINLIDNQPY